MKKRNQESLLNDGYESLKSGIKELFLGALTVMGGSLLLLFGLFIYAINFFHNKYELKSPKDNDKKKSRSYMKAFSQ